jgi:hypothetical protein
MHPSLLFLSGEPTAADETELSSDLEKVLDWSNSRYVLVHHSLLKPEQAAAIEHFLDAQPQLARLRAEKDLVIYQIIDNP